MPQRGDVRTYSTSVPEWTDGWMVQMCTTHVTQIPNGQVAGTVSQSKPAHTPPFYLQRLAFISLSSLRTWWYTLFMLYMQTLQFCYIL